MHAYLGDRRQLDVILSRRVRQATRRERHFLLGVSHHRHDRQHVDGVVRRSPVVDLLPSLHARTAALFAVRLELRTVHVLGRWSAMLSSTQEALGGPARIQQRASEDAGGSAQLGGAHGEYYYFFLFFMFFFFFL